MSADRCILCGIERKYHGTVCPAVETRSFAAPAGSAPDKPGFWWFKPVGDTQWEMVEARDIMNGHICLYAVSGKWGGYTLTLAAEWLKGEWFYVPAPNTELRHGAKTPDV